VIVDAVTSRYAGALYGLARKKGAVDAISKDIAALAAEVAKPATKGLLFNPRMDREAKRAQLGPVLDSAHPLTRNFVQLLLDKDREYVLRNLAAAWKRFVLDERGEIEGRVESARPLDPTEIARLANALSKRLGRTLTLENHVQPELLGGARVFAANRMVDWTVQGRLQALRRRMLDSRLPSLSDS